MKNQKHIWGNVFYGLKKAMFGSKQIRFMLICGHNTGKIESVSRLKRDSSISVIYSDFKPNPTYENVLQALELFEANNCNAILAVGGGSAIDVAKCVKAFYGMDKIQNFLEQAIVPNQIPMIVAPTTAGTGSDATSFAVLYFEGKKYSVENTSLLPETVLMDEGLLETLPLYQKKVTMLDAFCHCVESFWSKNGNEESQSYAIESLKCILANYQSYLDGDSVSARNMLSAANLAGSAINISKTTAAHAMCYQLTSMYHIPHGHAAALCLVAVWKMTWKKALSQGDKELTKRLETLAFHLECATVEDSIRWYEKFLNELDIKPVCGSREDRKILSATVNLERLENHPVSLQQETIWEMYGEIIGGCI